MIFEKLTQLKRAVEAGLVKAVSHKELPLTIYCHTRYCKLNQLWEEFDGVALDCRGLILDDWGNVVARPYKKFFHLNQDVGPLTIREEDLVQNPVEYASEKIDGSLVIIFCYGSKWLAATKCSFDSDQARFAQKILDEHSKHIDIESVEQESFMDYTFCCEAVYPANKNIVDYHDNSVLILHGILNKNGTEFLPSSMEEAIETVCSEFLDGNVFKKPNVYGIDLEELDYLKNALNQEGFVFVLKDGQRVKWKTNWWKECYEKNVR